MDMLGSSTNRGRIRKLALAGVVLLGMSLACSLPGGQDGGDAEENAAIKTMVAKTLVAQSQQAGKEAKATQEAQETAEAEEGAQAQDAATPTVQPTNTPQPPEPDIVYQGVSFAYPPSLANSVNAEIIPAEVDEMNPWSRPEHIRFLFNGYTLPETYLDPLIEVYPVEEFRSVNEMVRDRLDNLQNILNNRPADPPAGVVNFFNAGQFLRTQEGYLEFQNGAGVRFVSQYGQAAYPIGYPQMFYAFQGLTADGAYFISAIFPISHPDLPEADSVTVDQEFSENYQDYTAEVEAELDGKTPDSFQPSMLLLDDVIESLLVAAP